MASDIYLPKGIAPARLLSFMRGLQAPADLSLQMPFQHAAFRWTSYLAPDQIRISKTSNFICGQGAPFTRPWISIAEKNAQQALKARLFCYHFLPQRYQIDHADSKFIYTQLVA
jgi:hypothetical protein